MLPHYEYWAVVPTRGDRHQELARCLGAISPQVDQVVVVDNSDHGRATAGIYVPDMVIKGWRLELDPQQPPNLSQLWNRGIDLATRSGARWVAVLNDDAIVPPNWLDQITAAMLEQGCAAGSYGWGGGKGAMVHRTPGVTPLHARMCGWAFVLDATRGLRADERLQWWCGDNDLDMQARAAGGTVVLAGDPVQHLYPDQSTRRNPELAARTGQDMKNFVDKWGFRPWVI